MMARMTETPRPLNGTRDPRPGPERDPGPDAAGTETHETHETLADGTRSRDHRDPVPGPGSDRDRDPGPETGRSFAAISTPKIEHDGSGLGSRQTRDRGPQTPDLSREFGPIARIRIRRAARRRAINLAIDRGVEAEMILREAGVIDEAPAVSAARWEQFVAGWPQFLLTVAVAILAASGQVAFAKELGAVGVIAPFGIDFTPWFAPAVLDLSVAALFGRGMYVAVKHQGSPWLAWGVGFAIGAFSVYTNTLHEKGALLFAAASAVGLVSWMVSLIYKWWSLPHVKAQRETRKTQRQERRATANPRLLTTSLILASRDTATRGWVISRRRPLVWAAEQISMSEGRQVGVRDLTIRAAELFNSVLADRTVAELAAIGPAPDGSDKQARKSWREKRKQAIERANLVAWDAVDGLLGIPLIEREGIQVNRITYREPDVVPHLIGQRSLPVQVADTQPPVTVTGTVDTAEAAPAVPTTPLRSRRQAPALPPVGGSVQIGRPSGNAGDAWMAIEDIVDMVPQLADLPKKLCECHPSDPSKYCGGTLSQHVQNKGQYLVAILRNVDQWDTRPERIGTTEIRDIIKKSGKGLLTELSWVLDQIREVMRQRREAAEQLASDGTVVVTDEGETPPAE